MKYKKSFYNIIIDKIDGKYLLFNSLSGSLVLLNEECKNFYDRIEDIYDLNDQELEYFNLMKENALLVDYDLDEYGLYTIKEKSNRYNPQMFTLTIAPTMNCNMNCPYCYEKKEQSKMDKNIIDKLFDFAIENIKLNSYKEFHVAWYGGEPLLAKDIIYDLSEKFIDFCNNNNVIYTSSIVSNGTLLDNDTAKNLCKYKIDIIQITLDGMPETNNKRRLLKNRKPSFDVILNSIKIASEFINVKVRCNIDKENVHEIRPLINLFNKEKLLDKGNIELYFAPVTNYTEVCKSTSCFTNKEFVSIQKDILDIFSEFNATLNIPKLCNSCSATGLGTYVIDSEGYIYKCWDEIEIKEQSIGNVKTGLKVNNRLLKWINSDFPDICKECKLLPVCGSECPFVIIQNSNFKCNYKNLIIDDILRRYYKQYKKNKEEIIENV